MPDRRIAELKKKGLGKLGEPELREYFALLVRVGERGVLKQAYCSLFDMGGEESSGPGEKREGGREAKDLSGKAKKQKN